MTSNKKYFFWMLLLWILPSTILFGTTTSKILSFDNLLQPTADCVWTGNVNDDWNNAGNWDCGKVPEVGDGAVLSGAQITVNVPVEVDQLIIANSSNVTFNGTVTTPLILISGADGIFNESVSTTQFTVQSGNAMVNSQNVTFTNLQVENATATTPVPSVLNQLNVFGGEVVFTNTDQVTVEDVEMLGNAKIEGEVEIIVNQSYNQDGFDSQLDIAAITFQENAQARVSSGRIGAVITNNTQFSPGIPLFLDEGAAIINNGNFNWNGIINAAETGNSFINNGVLSVGSDAVGGTNLVDVENNGVINIGGPTFGNVAPIFANMNIVNNGNMNLSGRISIGSVTNETGSITVGPNTTVPMIFNGGNLNVSITDRPQFNPFFEFRFGYSYFSSIEVNAPTTLNINVVGDFEPVSGDIYPIGFTNGPFSTVNFPPGAMNWQVDYPGNAIQIIVGTGGSSFDCSELFKNIGDACNDFDPCTINDTVQADCNCVGTFVDTDEDGVCDFEDQCDGAEPGLACDDGSSCTVDDMIQEDCECRGTFVDSDNDGVCDAEDVCPDGPDPGRPCDDNDASTMDETIQADCSCGGGVPVFDCIDRQQYFGESCNDGDACTTNDIVQDDCGCAGTFQDTDSDGVCDAEDTCPNGPDPGTPCDDNNPCTSNDQIQSFCGCAGTLLPDSDGDGVCDGLDVCPNGPEPGTPCDDGNPNTTGETILADCNCGGGQLIFDCQSQQKNIGDTCDDGDPCTNNDVILFNCGCAGTFVGDDDNDGVCNALDVCPNSPEPGMPCDDGNPLSAGDIVLDDCTCQPTIIIGPGEDDCPDLGKDFGDACDDNDICTINDRIREDCSCRGDFQDTDNDGTCNALDVCNTGPEPGTLCDDGDPCTINDVINTNCQCEGTALPDEDQDGICDSEDICPEGPAVGSSCDDGDPTTNNEEILDNCTCNVPPTSDGDSGGPDGGSGGPSGGGGSDPEGGIPDCRERLKNIGDPCYDGDPCTIDDEVQSDCSCAGTPLPDTDNNGICDDCLIGNIGDSCDDGDPSTINDKVTEDCICKGNKPVDCDGVTIAGGEEQITVDNLTAAGEIVQILGANTGYAPITICNGDCPENLVIPNLAAGEYTVKVQMFGDEPGEYCYKSPDTKVFVTEGDNLCPNGPEPGSTCDDGDPNTVEDIIQSDCSCQGVPFVFDCPDLQLNIGDGCDDGDPATTTNDIIQTDCSCQGIPIVFDCPDLQLNVGDPCDDNDVTTSNDFVQDDCGCVGSNEMDGGPANCSAIQFSGGSGQIIVFNLSAESETVTIIGSGTFWVPLTICDGDCPPTLLIPDLFSGDYQVKVTMQGNDGSGCFRQENVSVQLCDDLDNDGVCDTEDKCINGPEPGTPCNDNNPDTFIDIILADCSCAGTLVEVDCPDLAKNIGDPCDDGNDQTINDGVTADCTCEGVEGNVPAGEANCDEIGFFGDAGRIFLTNLNATNELVQIIGAGTNWELITVCNNDCGASVNIENLPGGSYQVKVLMSGTNGTGCFEQVTISIDDAPTAESRTGLKELQFQLFPNPAQDQAYIQFPNPVTQPGYLKVYNYLGKEMLYTPFEKLDQQTIPIDLSDWTNGIYFIQIKTENSRLTNKKLIINRLY